MFWKNTAWSWDDAIDNDDDDDGYLLAADFKGDPDLAPDRDLNHTTTAPTTANRSNNNHSTTVGLKDLIAYSQTSSLNPIKNNDDCTPAKADCSSFVSMCYPRTNLVPTNNIQWLKVSHMVQTFTYKEKIESSFDLEHVGL